MEDLAQESIQIVTVNHKNKPIDRHLVFLGSETASLLHPSTVLRLALIDGATGFFLLHNHPSGDPTPSGADITITARVIHACLIVGLNMIDHVIVSRGGFYSFCENRPSMFGEVKP
jgi:DNA repair protein RadC